MILNSPFEDDEVPWWDDDPNFPSQLSPEVQEALAGMSSPKGATTRVITVAKDHILDYPELHLEVHVIGPAHDCAGFPSMFARARSKKARSLETADLVVFAGGSDVDPALYGELPHPKTFFDADRDTADIDAYMKCLSLGIPMLGVCRGAQFLAVMNGAKLYQDVDNHVGAHPIFDCRQHVFIEKASSVHHQMVIPNKEMIILATASKSRVRAKGPRVSEEGMNADVEAFFFPDTCCLGIQGHPEYSNYPYFTVWSLNKIEEWILYNNDVDWIEKDGEKHLRLKPDVLEAAKMRAGVTTTIGRAAK